MIQNKDVIKPNETPILFVNFSDKTFTFAWDKVPYTLAAKETRWLPFWLAEHAAKHLVDIEMNEHKIPTDHFSRETFIAKCIGNKPEEVNTADPLGLEVLNKSMNAKAKKADTPRKGGRPKKVEVTDEESLEGK